MEVVVVRAFLLGGVRQEPGSRVEVDKPLARELIALGKAAPAHDGAAERGPITSEHAAALVPGKWPAERLRKEN